MQPTLFDTGENYVPDIITVGHSSPKIRHPDHSVRAMTRPFISWDGEGYTDEWGQHHYWLLANSLGDRIEAYPGRSIERWNLARVFHSVQSRVPHGIHVGFALGYDFTMQLRSNGITPEQREQLSKKQYMKADGYMWRVMMGKQLTTWAESGGSMGERFNLQDTWGFFQRSFVKALDEYFPNPNFDKNEEDSLDNPAGIWPNRALIIEMKNKRSTFTREQDDQVKEYNDIELALLVTLMEELRDRLYQSGMPVSRWYGPGAIANGLLAKWKIKSKIINLYEKAPNLASVAQHAYAGGRFELVKPGHVNGKVYQYDVNSAYPDGLKDVPNLAKGSWARYDNPNLEDLSYFSVVRIRWNTQLDYSNLANAQSEQELFPLSIPFPLWRRTPDKTIHFPSTGIHGWYWLPEVISSIAYGNSLPAYYKFSYSIEEAYSFHEEDSSDRPYASISMLYQTRQQLKAKGNGAHIGIKLGLNSLYGKFAQQVGYDEDRKVLPPYHNLAIAGYITATCRARMIDACIEDPTSIIAFETDGIFSKRPLGNLSVSTNLGGWDLSTYDDMWYLQSGFRFGIKDGKVIKAATRGVPAKDISLDRFTKEIRNCLSTLSIDHTQFITLGQAYAWRKPHLSGQWRTSPRVLSVMLENPHGKRIHDPDCYMCDADSDGIRSYRWNMCHFTVPKSGYEGTLSYPHAVIWSVTDSELDEPQEDVIIEP